MIEKSEYRELVKKSAPKSKMFRTLLGAFVIGGMFCVIGQAVADITKAAAPQMLDQDVKAITSMSMIFLGALLTGLGVYDRIAKHAGAGSLIPITGFANAVVAPAMEFNREGVVFGICSKMFTIAGSIIVFGVSSSVLVGLVTSIIIAAGG